MTRHTPWFDTAVTRLADPQNQRVWSIIVSLLGDLARRKGDRISGSALTRITQPMGIKPEAMRVALHRLRKDGWIESSREGRSSVHYLSEYGRTQSDRVTPRIYTRTPELPEAWHILIAEDGSSLNTLNDLLLTDTYIGIGRTVALGSGPVPGDCDDLAGFEVSARAIPGWLQTRLFPEDLGTACQSLHQDCAELRAAGVPGLLTPFQVATLRTLLVHRWRRVALRHPDLPAAFQPRGWMGPACREQVFALLDALPLPPLPALNEAE
ncbi:PaaX family transcriptional regulator [Ruegeria pomeroyi]|uniref:PaaX domain protein n=2 Tax=Ruegeria pomeroyi TaxID=89184 RepID=Q5LVG8_RUEPO|nr:PaaX family transcriptional regulator C-terminal domain-containing protein [Ruegeria pomeroyi]HCE71913.1 PaaX family transcriptional regulator [Ruegeria sp.]AAV94039.1 PaaX domain protein [Ruegeria pomeroyi DSS-3]NVK98837.1 PaaX family transcriptional regulator [Ruegeria pomeroyi]NVL02993.1 PaaX family transcriptional regulator [Ruegeria pomeroyi]QWV07623.1 PaaX family transcriptional regulator [Ruegeria pomeroyi]